MKRTILLLILCSMSFMLKGQVKSMYQDTLCGERFCVDCGEDNKADFKKSSLSEFFRLKLMKYDLSQIIGVIQIQIIVDRQGNACCKHFINNTNSSNEKIAKLLLHSIVNSMPKWVPAKTKGINEISSVLVNLEIQKFGKIKADIERMNTKEWIIEKVD